MEGLEYVVEKHIAVPVSNNILEEYTKLLHAFRCWISL